ncbi:FecCD family ABC transporter permease [Hwanghaeella sp.]|uniref:FecCD family ABC transporter permease n=1 Tax=Hwanghaeella sp. TaxID=2605943 RepID=UPI003CCB8BB7
MSIAEALPARLIISRRMTVLGGLFLVMLSAAAVALSFGAYPVNLLQVVASLSTDEVDRAGLVILQVRLPRVVFGLLVGAALGGSGAALQVMFRNPLADPSLIGITSGAAFGAVSAIVVGGALIPGFMAWASYYAIPAVAFIGASVATVLIVAIGQVNGRVDVALMLLAGIAINAIGQSGVGAMMFLADDQQLRTLSFWTLGSLAIAGWDALPVIAVAVLVPVGLLALNGASLNRLLLGDVEAAHLGVDVRRLKRLVVFSVALSVGAAVSFAGSIFFVGLVVPHLVRLLAGPDNRIVVPGSILGGASIMVLADLVARTAAIPQDIPIGLVLGAVGGPFFLWLLMARKRRVI